MKRREFIAGLGVARGGACAVVPTYPADRNPDALPTGKRNYAGARARIPRGTTKTRLGIERQRPFDERWTVDNMELIHSAAENLVELKPDAILAIGGRVIPILTKLTRSIPIGMVGY
jgi:hypothetical protein